MNMDLLNNDNIEKYLSVFYSVLLFCFLLFYINETYKLQHKIDIINNNFNENVDRMILNNKIIIDMVEKILIRVDNDNKLIFNFMEMVLDKINENKNIKIVNMEDISFDKEK
jgi:hypothetical protein